MIIIIECVSPLVVCNSCGYSILTDISTSLFLHVTFIVSIKKCVVLRNTVHVKTLEPLVIVHYLPIVIDLTKLPFISSYHMGCFICMILSAVVHKLLILQVFFMCIFCCMYLPRIVEGKRGRIFNEYSFYSSFKVLTGRAGEGAGIWN